VGKGNSVRKLIAATPSRVDAARWQMLIQWGDSVSEETEVEELEYEDAYELLVQLREKNCDEEAKTLNRALASY
jgi:hypothetical protein